jgi:hypothetical protein
MIFWSLTQNGDGYDLCLIKDSWVIMKNNQKILTYNESLKKWVGASNGRVIKIEWPTFRDIIIRYIEQTM